MDADIFERLRSVPAERRPIPFWSWNDRLDPEELRRQVAEMSRAGVGGFFMHARGGLETDYLGAEWMDCVAACLSEGAARGLDPWLYDEEGWPSGFAGGRVPARGPERWGRWLVVDRKVGDPAAAFASEGFLSLYLVEADGSCRRVPSAAGAESAAAAVGGPGAELVAVRQRSTPYYVDVLDEETIAAFLEETHERYRSRFPGGFAGSGEAGKGPRFRGFFTDEPRFSGSIDRDPPWSLRMSERFQDRYGYDILDRLAALFLPVEGYGKVRYDYYRLASELFVSAFTKQIGDWCRSRGVELTGHLMMEEGVFVQAANTAGVMPHYEHMDVPGVDWLRRPIGSPVVPKQVGSAAAQLGKKRVITESFALAGWDVSFEELKRIVEWQYVNGVNLLCQHLEAYTLRGFRKRDYPPSMFFQQPWWDEYRRFNDYVGRLGMLLSEGESAVSVLVLHPMRSGWVLFDGTEYTPEFRALDKDFASLCETLSGAHLEYHLGDETILSRHGSVRPAGSAAGPRLAVGLCSYEAVVLPSLRCLASGTLSLLEDFADRGGAVIAAGDLPDLLDGEPSDRLRSFLDRVERCAGPAAAASSLRGRLAAAPSVADAAVPGAAGAEIAAIHLTERRFSAAGAVPGCRAWFLVNLDQGRAWTARVRLPGAGLLRLYRAEDGSFEPCAFESRGGWTETVLDFEPMRSRILVLDDAPADEGSGSTGAAAQDAAAPALDPYLIDPDGEWELEAADLNALTLDSCSYRVDGGDLQGETPVIRLMQELLELRRPVDIELRFSFESGLASGDLDTCFLAVERAEEFSMEVNGTPVPYRDEGWWKDGSFRKVDIRGLLRRGDNEVVLRRRFFQRDKVYEVLFGKDVYETERNKLTYDVELESIYLVGDFAVRSLFPFAPGERNSLHTPGPFVLEALPRTIRAGNLVPQGFPFFAGSLTLSRTVVVPALEEGRRALLRLNKPRAVAAAVGADGVRAAFLPWAPWEVDLTGRLSPGAHRLSLTLWSGNRNLLGPHHHVAGEPYNVGPDSFTGRWSWVEKATEAEPAPQADRVRSYWKDGYAFVSFGLVP